MRKIVTAGSILVDKINGIDAYPKAGELAKIRSLNRVPGGLVPNVGRDIRILSPDIPVAAAGMVGSDDDGSFAVRTLKEAGIDVSGVIVSETSPTSFTEVMSVEGGERTFFTYPGASACWGYDDFPFDGVKCGDIVLLGYFLLLDKIDAGDGLKILKELKARGAETAIDLVTENSTRYNIVRECLPYVDYLIVNEIEASRIAGAANPEDLRGIAEKLSALGVRKKVVIHHPKGGGSLSKLGDGSFEWTERPAVDVPDGYIKGKTGAGDAFCAGALVGIYRNLTDGEIIDAGSLAAVGALGAAGATDGMRSLPELEKLVSSF